MAGNLLAAISVTIAAISGGALLYAYIFAEGNDAIPNGTGELAIWFVLPVTVVLGAGFAIWRSTRAADHGANLLWPLLADGAAVAALIAWWLYVGSLTG